MDLNTYFRNPHGAEVAGTWFDAECGEWRVSTVPVLGFQTEPEAVVFYHSNCDALTGMLSTRHREPLFHSDRQNEEVVQTNESHSARRSRAATQNDGP